MAVASLVDRATSDLLIGPDWGRNLELCDAVNSDPSQAKEVVKAARKRLANKNPTVQLLTLTVLETLIKNCGDSLHQQVAERDVLHEMVKIVKKKGDLNVRDKVLDLLDSWQEAFGGQRGRYPQFFSAYDEVRRSGVVFPQRQEAAPIFTPPQSYPIAPVVAPAFQEAEPQVPLDVDIQRLSLADIGSARSGMEILSEMLSAVDPRDKAALKEELIVELVEECRKTQKQVLNLVSTTTDETLLFQALSLNDDLQKVLTKHDAIAAGTPVRLADHDEEESEDDFAQLAHRSRSNADASAPKPSAPPQAPPQLVRIPGPPPPPPAVTTKASSHAQHLAAVDLLSGDAFGGAPNHLSATKAKQIHAPPDHSSATKAKQIHAPPDPSSAAKAKQIHAPPDHSSTMKAKQIHAPPEQIHAVDDLEENVNPFSLQSPRASNGGGAQQIRPPQQQQASSLPPPPKKHSQRQQFFQQQQQQGSDADANVNPFASLYRREESGRSAAPPSIITSNSSSNSNSAADSSGLFSDLVDLQSARMRR